MEEKNKHISVIQFIDISWFQLSEKRGDYSEMHLNTIKLFKNWGIRYSTSHAHLYFFTDKNLTCTDSNLNCKFL